jgi:hypothetical protein
MTPNLVRSLIMNLLIAFGLFWLFGKVGAATKVANALIAVVIGLLAFAYHPYSQFIWFEAPDIWAHLLDSVLPFAVLGFLAPVRA